MHDSSTDQNFDLVDFQEAPSIPRAKGYPPIVIGVGGALAGVILAIIMIRGSMPEMSPEQIVAMEGYEGEQPPRYIFNLDSLEASRAPAQLDVRGGSPAQSESAESGSTTNAVNIAIANQLQEIAPAVDTADRSVARTQADSVSALLAITTEEPKETWPLEIVEVPASPLIVGKDAQEVAAPIVEEFDYRKLNRGNGLRTQKTVTAGRMAVPVDQTESTSTIRVLPVFTVNTDSAYVRAEPTEASDIKLVLAKGMSVTAFEQAGVWVHVGANDGSSITGYVHQSKISVTEIN